MSHSFSKYVSENETFAINWTGTLSNANNGSPDTILTSVWQAQTGITVVTDSISGNRAIVRVSGGTAGTNYTLENTITLTTSGYTLIDFINILVRPDPVT